MAIIVRKMIFFVTKSVENIDLRRITVVKNMFFIDSKKFTNGILHGNENLEIVQQFTNRGESRHWFMKYFWILKV